eukprot:TRINITY_DN6042_c0_g1_i1.p2 TRINITY_DN6042_c0_g1~~TRINITY_DN6042_c0_g1_i1.p2  ORF type:complete len:240 (+),score=46.42 TRINITY_DN6042_c0_g1_i1:144-863(+)
MPRRQESNACETAVDEALLLGRTVEMPRRPNGAPADSVLQLDTVQMKRAGRPVAEEVEGVETLRVPRPPVDAGRPVAEEVVGLETVKMTRSPVEAGRPAAEEVIGLETVQMSRSPVQVGRPAAEEVLGLETVQMARPPVEVGRPVADPVLGLETVQMARPRVQVGEGVAEVAVQPRNSSAPKDMPRVDRELLEAKLREIDKEHEQKTQSARSVAPPLDRAKLAERMRQAEIDGLNMFKA